MGAAYKAWLAAQAQLFGRDATAAVRVWRGEAQAEAAAAGGEAVAAAAGGAAVAVATAGATGAAEAERVAAWLFELPGLSPKQVGAVLAAPDPFNVAVLASFMRRFRFEGLRIDQALRLYSLLCLCSPCLYAYYGDIYKL